MNDSKYVVFKRADWDQFATGMGEGGVHSGGESGIYITDLSDRAVDDAVVIRKKDVFAPPALDAYANSITVALQMVKTVEGEEPTALAEQLQGVADYFHAQAADAWDRVRTLPTP